MNWLKKKKKKSFAASQKEVFGLVFGHSAWILTVLLFYSILLYAFMSEEHESPTALVCD